jgi:nucleoid DNA-binding protein
MLASKSLQKFQMVCRPVPRQSFSTVFPFNSINTTTLSTTTSTNSIAEKKHNQVSHFSTTTTTGTTTTKEETSPMTKMAIAEEIAHTHELSLAQSKRILNTVFDTIVEAVGEGRTVRVKGFGSFESYISKERQGVNPNTKEKIVIPAKRRIRFKPSSNFKDM